MSSLMHALLKRTPYFATMAIPVAVVIFLLTGCKHRQSQTSSIENVGDLKVFSTFNKDLLSFIFNDDGYSKANSSLMFMDGANAAAAESILARIAIQQDRVITTNTNSNGIKILVLTRIIEAIEVNFLRPCLNDEPVEVGSVNCFNVNSGFMELKKLGDNADEDDKKFALRGLWERAIGYSESLRAERDSWVQSMISLSGESKEALLHNALFSLVLHPRFLLYS
jgi:hypothetical protein